MRTSKKGSDWSQLWKRNAVVAAIALFVCAAVYLNWNYGKDGTDTDVGKTLGQSAMVGGKTQDPLLTGDSSAQTGGETGDTSSGTAPTAGEDQGSSGTGNSAYFATARLNRQQARDNALSLLQEAAGDEKADQSSIDEANAAIQTMAGYTVTEAQIENLITAKGYADCVAFLGEDSISVVVSALANGMTDADAARIGEIVMEQTGLKADQIKIIEAE